MRRMDEKFFAHTRFQPYGTAVMFLGIVLHKLFASFNNLYSSENNLISY